MGVEFQTYVLSHIPTRKHHGVLNQENALENTVPKLSDWKYVWRKSLKRTSLRIWKSNHFLRARARAHTHTHTHTHTHCLLVFTNMLSTTDYTELHRSSVCLLKYVRLSRHLLLHFILFLKYLRDLCRISFSGNWCTLFCPPPKDESEK